MTTTSIIIPSFNHGHFLRYTLESVLGQSHPDWEAIVVDDGSTDDTALIVANFAEARIRYVYQENQGLSAARNTGIRHAQSEYLAFLDADDTWKPHFLERCLAVLSHDSSLAGVYTLNDFIDQDGITLPQLGGEIVPRDRFRERCLLGGFFPVHAALVRRDIVQAVGGFDTTLCSEEDWDLWLRIAVHGEMAGIPEPLARYRLVIGSMSTNAARMHASSVAVLEKYYGPDDDTEPETWPAEKRIAYGYAHRSGALRYLQQQDEKTGLAWLAQAVCIWPPLLNQVETYYELAFANQPLGRRGQVMALDLIETRTRVLRQLECVLSAANPAVRAYHCSSRAYVYLTLAILSDQAGDWAAARTYLWQALRRHPRFLGSSSVMRRLLKVSAGKHTVALARRCLGRAVVPTIEGEGD